MSQYRIAVFADFASAMAAVGQAVDIGLRKNGYLFIVPPADRDVLHANFATQRRLGCAVTWLEPCRTTGRADCMASRACRDQ